MSETVIPLDACCFDAKEASRFKSSQCGCVNESIGCAVGTSFNLVVKVRHLIIFFKWQSSGYKIYSL